MIVLAILGYIHYSFIHKGVNTPRSKFNKFRTHFLSSNSWNENKILDKGVEQYFMLNFTFHFIG